MPSVASLQSLCAKDISQRLRSSYDRLRKELLGIITVEFCPIEDELRIEVPCTLLSLIEAPRFLPAISSTTVIIEGYKGIYKVSCMSEHWLQLCFEICTECVEVIPKLEFPIQ